MPFCGFLRHSRMAPTEVISPTATINSQLPSQGQFLLFWGLLAAYYHRHIFSHRSIISVFKQALYTLSNFNSQLFFIFFDIFLTEDCYIWSFNFFHLLGWTISQAIWILHVYKFFSMTPQKKSWSLKIFYGPLIK